MWKTSDVSDKHYKIGDVLEVTVEKIIPNGLGLCFAENLTVFVPLSVAGDRLRVEIAKMQGRRAAFARIVEITEPSEQRVEPECVYFGTCGGCDFQQMTYAEQLAAKVGILRDCLKRIGKIEYEPEIPIIASPREYGYRLRTQLHADPQTEKLGYFKRQSHRIIDAKSCPILLPELERNLQNLRENLPWKDLPNKPVNIETAGGEQAVSVYADELIEPTAEIFYELGGKKFFFNARSFFQGNAFLLEELVETAVAGASGRSALDLFCGVGLFSLFLAERFERVFGVEANERAIEFARKNADHARLANVEFYAARVKDFLYENEFEDLDFILLDPPRSGVKRGTLEKIAGLNAQKITYVSCNPSTLARDLQILVENEYAVENITALDLFPQTHHVETVVHLSRR
jgi:23S rRNA (uracil1939-C5)-methyltransferase